MLGKVEIIEKQSVFFVVWRSYATNNYKRITINYTGGQCRTTTVGFVYLAILGLTFMFFHILFAMLLYFLISLSVGVEAGYAMPAVGFNNLQSGTAFSFFANRRFRIADMSLSIGTSFYSGENASYSLNFYGVRCGFCKTNWRFSPVIELGADYTNRKLDNAKEVGYSVNYTIGLLVNFWGDNLRIYPKFYYEGVTDFKVQSGFVGVKLGISYEI